MIWIVNEGYLATRNGRILNKKYEEKIISIIGVKNMQICYNEDIE